MKSQGMYPYKKILKEVLTFCVQNVKKNFKF